MSPGIPPKKTSEHMLRYNARVTGKHACEHTERKIIKYDEYES